MAKKSSRKTTPQRRKAPPPKRVPGWVWLLGLSAFFAFAGFLYYLTGVQPEQSPPQAAERKKVEVRKPAEPEKQVAAKPKPAPKDDKKAKTEQQAKSNKQKEDEQARFKFYEMLPQTEVIPPVEEYQPSGKPQDDYHYLLQTGSFRTVDDAERQRALIAFQGIKGNIDRITTNDGTQWYRVNVGPFTSRSSMDKTFDKLTAINIQPLVKKIKQTAKQ